MKRSKRINHLIRLTCLAGALFCYNAAGYAEVMSNTALPTGGALVAGNASGFTGPVSGNIMNITGIDNAVIRWKSFDIGSIATVNFSGKEGFNVLNYVASGGNMSQIHGTLNAKGGNVYLVNPAGVFIGKSAQIDVSSLYVSNKKITALENWQEGSAKLTQTPSDLIKGSVSASAAELMSLGHINATKVTFEGDRIVLDTEYVTNGTDTPIGAENINIIAPKKDDVVLGYKAYKGSGADKGYKQTDAEKNTALANFKTASDQNYTSLTKADGYMWIEDVEQLQAMNTNLTGNYALRNGIDATNTKENPFNPIASFKGKLDGLAGRVEGVDFGIFDLHVGDSKALSDNVGLFGTTDSATLKNLLFVSGSAVGNNNVGMLVGSATNNTKIENITTSADVSGMDNVGGVAGSMTGGSITGLSADDLLLNTGAVTGHKNVGGIVGSLNGGTLANARNLGQISGESVMIYSTTTENSSHNIGGLAGYASNSAKLSVLQNDMTVTGAYNVGGILGSGASITLEDAVNTADITADGNGYLPEIYYYFKVTETSSHSYTEGDWVRQGNTGGIAGNITGTSTLNNVTNDGGNVQSSKAVVKGVTKDYYNAGNIGGIVGYVKGDVNKQTVTITNAVNKENTVHGSHNVGGIVGFLQSGSVSNALNNGGDIMATGANSDGAFKRENIGGRNWSKNIIGNMGGIVGYMLGPYASVSQSGNRGSVHSMYITDHDHVPESAQAANAGGIVGKVARSTEANETVQKRLQDIKDGKVKATVSDCYNTGDVQGFAGVGGIVGQMFNGEITGSYNLGHIYTTRQDASGTTPVNIGGILGETPEKTDEYNAKVIVYDVYNSGIVGSEDFEYYARHVGGVIGRLYGYVEKAYNTGAVYNGCNVVGGIVGYVGYGNIKDCFNTGNITVLNRNNAASSVGGIVGGYDVRGFELTIENVYNLGTVRSFKYNDSSLTFADNYVGGIIGRILDHDSEVPGHNTDNSHLYITNAYTLGNIYAGIPDGNGGYKLDENAYVGAMYGGFNELYETNVTVKQAYYITPEDEAVFGDLSDANNKKYAHTYLTDTTVIKFDDRMKAESYKDKDSSDDENDFSFSTITNNGAVVNNKENPWRIYEGYTTPILNAFLPDAEKYFSANKDKLGELGVASLQYGTAYNPTLTIINALNGSNVTLDWSEMGAYKGNAGIDKGSSFAVYDGSLTINNFDTKGNYFGGTLYADGALNISNSGNIMLGSGSKLYGGSIDITSAGVLTGYGRVQSTGKSDDADITLSGAKGVEIIGAVKSAATDDTITVEGVDNTPEVDADTHNNLMSQLSKNINNPKAAMPDVADYYGRIVKSGASGDITIKSSDGDVNVLLGVAEKGYLQSAGSITLEGTSVYVDSDLKFGNDAKNKFTITADEAVLDISNIGKVQTAGNTYSDSLSADELAAAKNKDIVEKLHEFLHQGNKLSFEGKTVATPDAIIAVDMWNDDNTYNKGKYDLDATDTFEKALKAGLKAEDLSKVNIWLANAQQLNNINKAVEEDANVLTYNFALKNNIDANSLTGFQGIGYGLNKTGNATGTGYDTANLAFTGDFDGRGKSIIGLTATGTKDNNFDYVGLFSRIGVGGSVKDLNIISSEFTGSSVGAVAGRNEGIIENVTTFGNRVESNEYVQTHIFGDPDGHGVSAAGGITGINEGTISNVTASDAVIAGVSGNNESGTKRHDSTAGGIAGVNAANIKSSTTNSAITCSSGDANALGGVVGINYGTEAFLDIIESWGILNGKYKISDTDIHNTQNVGGIAGVNYNGAAIQNAYNEAHITGSNGIGGIVGYSGASADYKGAKNTITNAVNAGNIAGSAEGLASGTTVQNTGGIVGNNQNTTITNARNTGTIHGEENVGGMVGTNGENSEMYHVTNDGSATIVGLTNVGGIAGVNQGVIDAEGSDLTNNGTIHGHTNVGGVAGHNEASGTIRYMNSNITLYVDGTGAEYFGGVAGYNDGLITNATNTGYVNAEEAKYVGGIVGFNDTDGRITGAGNANSGKVVGNDYVGGIAGLNKGKVSGTADDATKVRNDGYVHAVTGGAGGIFGVNESNMQHVTLINGGIVYGAGEDGTGGLIGVNKGNINQSNLIGEVDAVVIGSANAGGLIGVNYGTVAGGRDQKDNYYAHQVYNNGTVAGGKYSEVKDDTWTQIGKDDNIRGYYTVDASSTNIGGLIGNNAGTLTAAYNTGEVKGGNNVGGVAGSNAGTIDQVFNAGEVKIYNGNVLNGAGSNGLYGVVGTNSNSGISNAYDINSNTVIAPSTTKDADDNETLDSSIWKTYGDGKKYGSDNLLNVFLTKIKFEQTADAQLLTQGQAQSITVKAAGKTVNVYTKDAAGKDVLLGYIQALDPDGAHSMADYLNSMEQSGLNSLLSGKTFDAVGTYNNLFSTEQININGITPNNLGYDIDSLKVTVVEHNPSEPPVPPVIVPPTVNPDDLWQAEDKYAWYGWDKQRNPRERKAEVNFVKGGMEI